MRRLGPQLKIHYCTRMFFMPFWVFLWRLKEGKIIFIICTLEGTTINHVPT